MARLQQDLPLRTAAGFVLVRRKATGFESAGFESEGFESAGFEYLALTNRRRSEPGLPKGHSNPGESALETALRETEEETGLTDLDVRGDFRRELDYVVRRRGRDWHKRVVLFTAVAQSGKVRLSEEHSAHAWLTLDEMLDALPYEDLDRAVFDAALFLKDPALFALAPATESEADRYLRSLPHATKGLLGHLRGAARLARRFAEALAESGKRVNAEATAVGTLLHDVGRALGDHADHQRAGLIHLRKTALAPYGFACISHFTKGARPKALRSAGVARDVVADFRRLIDLRPLTWEERCAALADACMMQDEPVRPRVRFADLRRRYDAPDLIDLQERQTKKIRRKIEGAIGVDPIQLVGLK